MGELPKVCGVISHTFKFYTVFHVFLNDPVIKYWGNKRISKIVSFVSKTKIQDASCGFRAYSKECLLNLNLQGEFTYTHETILDLLNKNFKVQEIPVKVKYFDGRVSRVANSIVQYALKTSLIIFTDAF